MALGELAKQLAEQAISESVRPAKPSTSPQPENMGTVILGQVQAMQKALKDDEELAVLFHSGGETVRVLEFFAPSWQVFVLGGIDGNRNTTRIISPVESLQLVCKVMKVQHPAKPVRINFVVPRRPE